MKTKYINIPILQDNGKFGCIQIGIYLYENNKKDLHEIAVFLWL